MSGQRRLIETISPDALATLLDQSMRKPSDRGNWSELVGSFKGVDHRRASLLLLSALLPGSGSAARDRELLRTLSSFCSGEEHAREGALRPDSSTYQRLYRQLITERTGPNGLESLGELLSDDTSAAALLLRESLRPLLGKSGEDLLDARERRVLQLRLGLYDGDPHTLEWIGRRMDVTRERVRQVQERAQEKLRGSAVFQELMRAVVDAAGEEKPPKRAAHQHSTSLRDLIGAHLLLPGEALFSTRPTAPGEARLRADGSIEIDGQVHSSASPAAQVLIAKTKDDNPEETSVAANDWSFWAVDRDGGRVTLEELRADYEHARAEPSLAATPGSELPTVDREEVLAREAAELLSLPPATTIEELVRHAGDRFWGRIPRLLDPMSGLGGYSLAAADLGCTARGYELDPLGHLIAKLRREAGANSRRRALDDAARRLCERTASALRALDPHTREDERVLAYLYVTELCDPTSGYWTPLLSSFLVSEADRLYFSLSIDRDEQEVRLQIRAGTDEDLREASRRSSWLRGDFFSIVDGTGELRPSGERVRIRRREADQLRRWGSEALEPDPSSGVRERLIALRVTDPNDKTFWRAPAEEDLLADAAVRRHCYAQLPLWRRLGLVPSEEMPPEARETHGRGWVRGWQLYQPRQLLMRALFTTSAESDLEREVGAAILAREALSESRLSTLRPRTDFGLSRSSRPLEQLFAVRHYDKVLEEWARLDLGETSTRGHLALYCDDGREAGGEEADLLFLDCSTLGVNDWTRALARSWAATLLRRTADGDAMWRGGDPRSPLQIDSAGDIADLVGRLRCSERANALLLVDGVEMLAEVVGQLHPLGWALSVARHAPDRQHQREIFALLSRRGDRTVGYPSELVEEVETTYRTTRADGLYGYALEVADLSARLAALSRHDRLAGAELRHELYNSLTGGVLPLSAIARESLQ